MIRRAHARGAVQPWYAIAAHIEVQNLRNICISSFFDEFLRGSANLTSGSNLSAGCRISFRRFDDTIYVHMRCGTAMVCSSRRYEGVELKKYLY